MLTDAPIHFGLIPYEDWYQPDWIDEDRARAGRQQMKSKGIIYGGKFHVRNSVMLILIVATRRRQCTVSAMIYHARSLQKSTDFWQVSQYVSL